MADLAHGAGADPVAYLEDVIQGLLVGAYSPTGMHLDQDLCRGLADGLEDVLDGVLLLVELAEEVRSTIRSLPVRRTRGESQILARMAVRLDPAGTVVSFPLPHSTPVSGGAA